MREELAPIVESGVTLKTPVAVVIRAERESA
jgi:hypothetical protein